MLLPCHRSTYWNGTPSAVKKKKEEERKNSPKEFIWQSWTTICQLELTSRCHKNGLKTSLTGVNWLEQGATYRQRNQRFILKEQEGNLTTCIKSQGELTCPWGRSLIFFIWLPTNKYISTRYISIVPWKRWELELI